MEYRYKNTSDIAYSIPNAGIVEPGETIETNFEISHPAMQQLKSSKASKTDEDKD